MWDKLLISDDGCVGANFNHPNNRKDMRDVINRFSEIYSNDRLSDALQEVKKKILPFNRLEVETQPINTKKGSPFRTDSTIIEYIITSKDYGITVVIRTDETGYRSSYRNVEIAQDMIFRELILRYYGINPEKPKRPETRISREDFKNHDN